MATHGGAKGHVEAVIGVDEHGDEGLIARLAAGLQREEGVHRGLHLVAERLQLPKLVTGT